MQPQYYTQNGRLTTAKVSVNKYGICKHRIMKGTLQYETPTFDRAHRECSERANQIVAQTRQMMAEHFPAKDRSIREHELTLAECARDNQSWLTDEWDEPIAPYPAPKLPGLSYDAFCHAADGSRYFIYRGSQMDCQVAQMLLTANGYTAISTPSMNCWTLKIILNNNQLSAVA